MAQEWDGLPMAFELKCGKIPRGQSLRLWKDRVDCCQSFIQQLIGTLVWLALHPARGIPEDLGQKKSLAGLDWLPLDNNGARKTCRPTWRIRDS